MTSRKRKTMILDCDRKTREKLRAEYLSVLNEPMPPRLKRLIDELKAAERLERVKR